MRFFARRITGLYIALALGTFAYAQDEVKEGKRLVRFITGKTEYVEVVSGTKEHVLLRFHDVPKPVPVRWYELHPRDAAKLKALLLGPDAKPPKEEFLIDGVHFRTKDGKSYTGMVLPGSGAGEIWVQSHGKKFVIRVTDVDARTDVRVAVWDVYTDEELYDILIRKMDPRTADQWEHFAAELVKVRLGDRAVMAFKVADLLRHPELPEGRIYWSLITLRDRLEDAGMKKAIHDIQEMYLKGQYDESLTQMERLQSQLTGKELKEVERLREEVSLIRGIAREEQIVTEWERVIAALLRSKAFDRRISFGDAKQYVEATLVKDVEKRINARFSVKDGLKVWGGRPGRVLQKHSFGDATWIFERAERSDPESWWSAADDNSRYHLLRGIAIERHYEVKLRLHKNCPTCGGDGVVSESQYPDRPADQCPACLGVAKQRVVVYR